MKVHDIMKTDVAVCGEHDSLNRAAQLMWERDVGAIPVVNATGYPTGIVTDRDISMAAYTQGRPLAEIPVTAAMAHGVLACGPSDTIQAVEAQLRKAQLHRIPVIDEGRLVGILSLNDIALAASDGRGSRVSFDEVGRTVAGICHHRDQSALAAE